MGRARFMFYPWFFLTARPWAERGSCFTRGLFFFLFFFFLYATRPKLPLGQVSNHATYDVLLKCQCTENRMNILLFI